MSGLRRMLLLTFLESFATILVERAAYFYAHHALKFSDQANLWLALAFGAVYAGAAVASHAAAVRLGERRLLLLTLGGQLVVHVVLALWAAPAALFGGMILLGGLNGLKWPIIESYVSAGRAPADTVRAVGRFNVSWSGAVPLALAAAGPIIGWWPNGIFLLAAVLNVAAVALSLPLTPRPLHLANDHPERPGLGELRRCSQLLVSSRWIMLASYALMWVLAALIPRLFQTLGYSVSHSTALSGLIDVCRWLTFVALTVWAGWRGRSGPIVVSMIGLPAGFFLVLYGPELAAALGGGGAGLAAVLAGEVLFGLAAGMTYFCALYYAMVVKNASVAAGGGHEGLIGSGFFLGPAAGLLGAMLHEGPVGITLGVLPILLVGQGGGIWALMRTAGCRDAEGQRGA